MILQEEQTDLATPTGPMRTYVYRPVARGRYPGLVLFSEIFQRTGPIKRTAALLAGHGFVVAVPEIFHELEPAGAEIAYDQAGADKGNADKVGKPVSAYDADARAALPTCRRSPHCTGKLGVDRHLRRRPPRLPRGDEPRGARGRVLLCDGHPQGEPRARGATTASLARARSAARCS